MIDFKLNQKADGIAGLVMGSVVAMSFFLAVVMLTFQAVADPPGAVPPGKLAVYVAVLVLASLAEWWFIVTAIFSMLRKRHPLVLTVAVLQPRLPPLLRPVMTLWWTGHALVCLLFGVTILFATPMLAWHGHLLITVLTGAFAHMTYVFVLLAVSAMTKSPTALARAWKLRMWWGGFVFVVAILFHFFGPPVPA